MWFFRKGVAGFREEGGVYNRVGEGWETRCKRRGVFAEQGGQEKSA